MSSRKQRGRESERIVADYLRARGWPFAEPVGAGRPGADITGTPSLAVEVKARRELRLTEWLKQARRDPGRVPLLVVRGDGQGPTTVHEWAAVLPLEVAVEILRDAGHGEPIDHPHTPPPEERNYR